MGYAKYEIPLDVLKEILHYDKSTGTCYWKYRNTDSEILATTPYTSKFFKSFNTRYAGKRAGSIGSGERGRKVYNIKINGINHLLHRVIWFYNTGSWPTNEIDHVDNNPLNNRLENLRPADRSFNCKNIRKHGLNTSGITGVAEVGKRWLVRWRDNCKTKTKAFYSKDKAVLYRWKMEIFFEYPGCFNTSTSYNYLKDNNYITSEWERG